MINKGMDFARGYIASGEFNGNRIPQHIQNQIVKSYCDANNLNFVLSRAEYWINGSTDCQLWAALKEGYKHIVFYSIWQLPQRETVRKKYINTASKTKLHCILQLSRCAHAIKMKASPNSKHLSNQTLLVLNEINYEMHLDCLAKLSQ